MGNCAHALAMKTRGLVNDSRYKTCCAQRCCSYATDECSNVGDARYSLFEETLVNDCISNMSAQESLHTVGAARTQTGLRFVLEH